MKACRTWKSGEDVDIGFGDGVSTLPRMEIDHEDAMEGVGDREQAGRVKKLDPSSPEPSELSPGSFGVGLGLVLAALRAQRPHHTASRAFLTASLPLGGADLITIVYC